MSGADNKLAGKQRGTHGLGAVGSNGRLRRRSRISGSRHMQCTSDRHCERTSYTHRIILLKPCNGLAYFRRKYTINWSAVITQATQRCLHGADIRGLCDELLPALKVVTPSPVIAWRK